MSRAVNPRDVVSFRLEHVTSESVTPQIEKDLTAFCAEAVKDQKHPVQNWNGTDWENSPASLMYCLLEEKRFSQERGRLYLLYHGDRLVALNGIYRSDFHPEVFIGGVRVFTLPEYRTRDVFARGTFAHSDHIFPEQLAWARTQGAKMFWLTFNDHNLWLAQWGLRIATGKASVLGVRGSSTAREFYRGFEMHPKKLLVKYIYQHVLVKRLDPSFEFSFAELEEK